MISKYYIIPFAFFAIVVFYSSNAIVYAHTTVKFGNTIVEGGWSNEPSLVGQVNSITLQASKVNGTSEIPILNALSNASISVTYGTLLKPLDFQPSEIADGVYEAKILPTRTGPYVILLDGDIKGQKISGEVKIEDVEGTQSIAFPDSSSQMQSSNNISFKIEGIIGQLASDIDTTKNDLSQLGNNLNDFQKIFQDIKKDIERVYFVSLAAVGAGLAGIVIGAFAVTKR